MAGFKGQAEHSIDGKGRVPVPAKMRRALSPDAKESFVATRGFEQCVFLYPADRWESMEDGFETLNPYQRETRDFLRTIFRWADEVTLDGQGRISLSKTLLQFAGLEPGQKALIIGSFDHIEIWDPEVFDAYLNQMPSSYEDVSERVMTSMNGNGRAGPHLN